MHVFREEEQCQEACEDLGNSLYVFLSRRLNDESRGRDGIESAR
ncbi:hypothetical protein SAMN04487969_107119 [Paenibacillus algorifonticola]|uniref:Uncharacterized protein n=1 Tax=Paenibacillus algorifonticola TaxID=684063 RepID=A0A1I2DNB8_9BACL|nr:hypothetical protein SAMN04487969_107119 [Paenibacillus algorifonticola]